MKTGSSDVSHFKNEIKKKEKKDVVRVNVKCKCGNEKLHETFQLKK